MADQPIHKFGENPFGYRPAKYRRKLPPIPETAKIPPEASNNAGAPVLTPQKPIAPLPPHLGGPQPAAAPPAKAKKGKEGKLGKKDKAGKKDAKEGKKEGAFPNHTPTKKEKITFKCGCEKTVLDVANCLCMNCTKKARAERIRRKYEKRNLTTIKKEKTKPHWSRLPHQSTIAAVYDATKEEWTGSLTIFEGEKAVAKFEDFANGQFRLMIRLDEHYRNWIAGGPPLPESVREPRPSAEEAKPPTKEKKAD